MKKKAIASVAFAAALFAVSCQKENIPVQNVSGPMTISAEAEGLNTPTKTELAFKYDVLWSTTDKIYVVDGSDNHDTFSLQNGAGTTKGSFKQDGDVTFSGEVQAYYPANMLQSGSPVWPAFQTDDQTIPMYCKKTLSGTTDERMDFSSLGSVLQIVFNTTQANVTLKSIEIKDGSKTMSGAFSVDADGKAVITATDKAGIILDLGTGVALGKGASYFNIAVPAGDYQDLTLIFTATDGARCKMTGGKVNISHNTVGRLTLTGEKFSIFGALPGVFSVSATKKVHFSKGNLWTDGSNALHFESNQYSFASSYDASHVSHLTWSDNITDAVSESYSGSHLFCDESNKQSVDDSEPIYYALSAEEWKYLFNRDNVYGETCRSGKYKWTTVNGVGGYVIAPDDFAGTLKDTYTDDTDLAIAGDLVFLPAAGVRVGSSFNAVGICGFYCSSDADGEDGASYLWFYSSSVSVNTDGRACGFSFRLVAECK